MSFSLIPDIIIDKITDLSPEWLAQRGIRLLLLDFDNTLLPYTNNTPDEPLLNWLEDIKSAQVTVAVVSNSKKDRVPDFCRTYGIKCVTHAKKPSPKGVLEAMERYKTDCMATALVGDQIYTDVLAANRAGVMSVLCTPIHLSNVFLKLRHIAEKPFISIGKGRMKHE